MSFRDLADNTTRDEFAEATIAILAMTLVAHLRWGLAFASPGTEFSSFSNVVREWFFAVDGYIVFHREHRRQSMVVVGGGDDHGIEFLPHLIEHLTVIGEDSSFTRIAVVRLQIALYFVVLLFVGIDNRGDIILGLSNQPVEMFHRPPAAANDCTVQLLARAVSGQDVRNRKQLASGESANSCSGAFDKGATVKRRIHKIKRECIFSPVCSSKQ